MSKLWCKRNTQNIIRRYALFLLEYYCMYVSRNGYQIYYETTGGNYPIFFIHGLGGSTKQIEKLDPYVAGCMLVSVDMQGHGFSGCSKNITFDSMAEDIIAVADDLNVRKFSVCGISMGAAIAINLAINHSDRVDKIFLVRSAWLNDSLPKQQCGFFSELATYLIDNNYDDYLKTDSYQNVLKVCPGLAESLLNAFIDSSSIMHPEKFKTIPRLKPFEELDDLSKIKAQTIVMYCDNDPLHPKEISKTISEKVLISSLIKITSPYENRNQYNSDITEGLKRYL